MQAPAAVLSGSFTVLPKYAMQKAQQEQRPVPRPVTAWWLALGFVCASAALSPFVRQGFGWAGLLSGVLWAFSLVGRVGCAEACGNATGNATPDIATLATAWVYDALWNHDRFTCPVLGYVGLLLLALCLLSVYVLEQQGHARRQLLAQLSAAGDTETGPGGAAAAAAGGQDAQLQCPLLHHRHPKQGASSQAQWEDTVCGLLLGVLSGVCSGLSQMPYKFAPRGSGGVHFLLSCSLGALLFASINVLLHRCLWSRAGLVRSLTGLDLHARAMAPWGLAGGAVLLAGTAFGILAAGDDPLGFSIAKGVAEGSILVSGAWGVLLFHELRSLLQVLFWLLSMQSLCSYAVVVTAKVATC